MRIKKDKVKSFYFPVFGYDIRVVSSKDISKALKKFKHTKDVEQDDTMGAITIHIHGEGISYIFLPYKITLEYMVHESYHAVRRMLEYCDVKLDNEVVAYHLGHLVQKISDWRWSWKSE